MHCLDVCLYVGGLGLKCYECNFKKTLTKVGRVGLIAMDQMFGEIMFGSECTCYRRKALVCHFQMCFF